jgi:hypothetical protein
VGEKKGNEYLKWLEAYVGDIKKRNTEKDGL